MQIPTNFCFKCHEDMHKNGFWEDMDEALEAARSWDENLVGKVRDAFLAQKIALVHDEISEFLEVLSTTDDIEKEMEELADVFLRLADIAGLFGLEFTEKQPPSDPLVPYITDLSILVSGILRSIRSGKDPHAYIIASMQLTLDIGREHFNGDIVEVILDKAEKNRGRPKKHGKRF